MFDAARQKVLDRDAGQTGYVEGSSRGQVLPLPERPPADAQSASGGRPTPVPVKKRLSDLFDSHTPIMDWRSMPVNCPSTIRLWRVNG